MGLYDILMDPKYDAQVAYLRRLARYKQAAAEWLVDGRRSRDLAPSQDGSSTVPVRRAAMHRAAGRCQRADCVDLVVIDAYPLVMSAAWLSRDQGSLAGTTSPLRAQRALALEPP